MRLAATHRTKPRGCQTWSSHEHHERRTCRRRGVASGHPYPVSMNGGRIQHGQYTDKVTGVIEGDICRQPRPSRRAAHPQYRRVAPCGAAYMLPPPSASWNTTTHLLGALLGDSGRRFLLGGHCSSLRCRMEGCDASWERERARRRRCKWSRRGRVSASRWADAIWEMEMSRGEL